jgi:hypothetical protein
MSTRQKILTTFAALLVLLALWYLFWPNRPIAKLNGEVVTTRTLVQYQGIEAAYRDPGQKALSKKDLFKRIVADAELRYVYQKFGGAPITEKELQDIAKSINQGSLAPSVLQKVQQALGGGESPDYLHRYIEPAVMRQRVQGILVTRNVTPPEAFENALKALLLNDAFKTSASVASTSLFVYEKEPQDPMLSEAGMRPTPNMPSSAAALPGTNALRDFLVKEKAFALSTEKNYGLQTILTFPAIIVVTPKPPAGVLVTLYTVIISNDPMDTYRAEAKQMPRSLYDPYFAF